MDSGTVWVGFSLSGARLATPIRPGGLLRHYGLLSGHPLTAALLAEAKATMRLFRLRDWVHGASHPALHAAMADTFADIRTGLTSSRIAADYPLAAFQDALHHNTRPDRKARSSARL